METRVDGLPLTNLLWIMWWFLWLLINFLWITWWFWMTTNQLDLNNVVISSLPLIFSSSSIYSLTMLAFVFKILDIFKTYCAHKLHWFGVIWNVQVVSFIIMSIEWYLFSRLEKNHGKTIWLSPYFYTFSIDTIIIILWLWLIFIHCFLNYFIIWFYQELFITININHLQFHMIHQNFV